jgi:hypothetical protein
MKYPEFRVFGEKINGNQVCNDFFTIENAFDFFETLIKGRIIRYEGNSWKFSDIKRKGY